MTELVIEDLSHGFPERLIFVHFPDAQVFLDSVDLYRFENEADSCAPEHPAKKHHHRKLEPPCLSQLRSSDLEKILPEPEMPLFYGNQLIQEHGCLATGRLMQFSIQYFEFHYLHYTPSFHTKKPALIKLAFCKYQNS